MTEARATDPHTAAAQDAPLTVLFYSDAPYEGGAERYIDYLVGELPRSWSVGAVVRRDGGLDAWAGRLATRGARVFRSPPAGAAALRTLWKAVREMHPDVVHINMPHSYSAHYTSAGPIARLAGGRSIVTTEHLTMVTPMRARGLLRRTLTCSVDRIITLTRSNRRDLVERHRLPAEKIAVVANGVPDPPPQDAAARAATRAALGAAPEDVLLLHVAALTERKGHAFLLDALARIAPHGWHLALVGEGEDETTLRSRVSGTGLASRVTFAGRRDTAVPLIQAADVVLLPSRLEGMPLTLLEALACGRPAIATRVFGVPEIYEGADAARLVAYGDVDALATALSSLVADASLRASLGKEARRLYETRYSAREMAARTVDVYRLACGAAS